MPFKTNGREPKKFICLHKKTGIALSTESPVPIEPGEIFEQIDSYTVADPKTPQQHVPIARAPLLTNLSLMSLDQKNVILHCTADDVKEIGSLAAHLLAPVNDYNYRNNLYQNGHLEELAKIKVGNRVQVLTHHGWVRGVVDYIGPTTPHSTSWFFGVELNPISEVTQGVCNSNFKDNQLFPWKNSGMFVKASEIRPLKGFQRSQPIAKPPENQRGLQQNLNKLLEQMSVNSVPASTPLQPTADSSDKAATPPAKPKMFRRVIQAMRYVAPPTVPTAGATENSQQNVNEPILTDRFPDKVTAVSAVPTSLPLRQKASPCVRVFPPTDFDIRSTTQAAESEQCNSGAKSRQQGSSHKADLSSVGEIVATVKAMGFSDAQIQKALGSSIGLTVEILVQRVLDLSPMDPSNKSVEMSEQERLCIICMEKPADHLFTPCGHLKTCEQCSDSLRQCPLCRQTIQTRIRAYL